jgi:hypothetical protein
VVLVEQSSQDWIRNLPGEELGQLHFGFGTQIRTSFGLWHSNANLRQSCGSAQMHLKPLQAANEPSCNEGQSIKNLALGKLKFLSRSLST